MRILRLDLGSTIGTLDLHPFVTIVSDLTREQGDSMAESVRSLVSGNTEGLYGLVENDGELIELGGSVDDRLAVMTIEDIIVALHELSDGEVPMVAMEAELDQLSRAADLDLVHVEQVRVGLNPTSAAEVFRTKELLNGNLIAGVSERLISQATTLRGLLGQADDIPATIGKVPQEVQEVTVLWEEYKEEEKKAKRHLDLLRDAVVEAEGALGNAMHEKVQAEESAVPLLLSSADDKRLEELVDPSGGKRRKKKVGSQEAVDAEIREILDSVGMPSYTAYVMHRLNPEPPADAVERLRVAEVQIDRATAALEEARAELEIDPVASQLKAHLGQVKDAAKGYLGPVLPDDLGRVLSEIVDYEVNPTWVEAVGEVRQYMVKSRIPFDPNAEDSQVCAVAAEWIADVDHQVETAEKIDPEVLKVQLDEAEERFGRHAKAMARIDRLEARAAASCQARDDLRDQIERMKAGNGSRADHILARLGTIVDRIVANGARPVPIICWGELDDLIETDLETLLEGLEHLSSKVQVIYVADSSRIRDWVSRVGLRRAMCSSVSKAPI